MKKFKILSLSLLFSTAISIPAFACNAQKSSGSEGLSSYNTCNSACSDCKNLTNGHKTQVKRTEKLGTTYGFAVLSGNSKDGLVEVNINGRISESREVGDGYLQTGTHKKGGKHTVKSYHAKNK